jgi:tRNA(Ile2) C34 agmatinyltransferase TiaS
MKCPYCGREVTSNGVNCPKCYAAIVKIENKAETKEKNKEAE